MFSSLIFSSLFALSSVIVFAPAQAKGVISRADTSQCAVDAIWPPGPGSALKPQPVQKDLDDILFQIDPKRVEAIITKLVSFGTRHTLSNQTDPARGIGAARDWIASQMRGFAAAASKGTTVTVDVPSYIQQPTGSILFAVNISNIITTIQGVDEPNRVYIITGHYDSRVTSIDNFTDDAPGADDDASGVAVVMELARIMATRPPPRATIMLGAVAGEEQGLFGSSFFAQQMKDARKDVQGMFTNDIVGSPKGDDGFVDANSIRLFAQGIPSTENATQVSRRVSIGGENDSPARQLARHTHEVASNSITGMSGEFTQRLSDGLAPLTTTCQCALYIALIDSFEEAITSLSSHKATQQLASLNLMKTLHTNTRTSASTPLVNNSAISSNLSTSTLSRASPKSTAQPSGRWHRLQVHLPTLGSTHPYLPTTAHCRGTWIALPLSPGTKLSGDLQRSHSGRMLSPSVW